MKKKDIILVIGILLIAGILAAAFDLFPSRGKGMVRITVDGTLYGEYSLAEDQQIAIGDSNICEIKNGQVKMIWANCPDQLCIHQKALDETGQGVIICLPNKITIEVTGGSEEEGLDAIAG